MNVATRRLSTAFALSLLLHAALLSSFAPPAQRGRAASDEALVVRFAVPTPPPAGVHPRERADTSPRARVRPVERELAHARPSVAIADNAPQASAPRREYTGSTSVEHIGEDSRQLDADRLSPRRAEFPGIASADLSELRVAYPRGELRAGARGRVLLEVLVSDRGKLVETAVVERVGSTDYETAALRAVRRLQFTPGVEGGRLAPSRLLLEFRFSPD